MEDPEVKLVREVVDRLGEHFDSVQVFVSSHREGQTIQVKQGVGNFYTRLGQVRDWLIKEDETTRREVKESSE